MRLREGPWHILCPPAFNRGPTSHICGAQVLLSSSITNSTRFLRWLGKNKIWVKLSPPCQQTCMLQSYESSRSCLPLPLANAYSTEITCLFQICDLICRGCWFSLPITERPGRAYSEMFPAFLLSLSSKRLFPSIYPSVSPQHVPLV